MSTILHIISISEKLLYAVKMDENTIQYENELATCEMKILQEQLSTDEAKKTFWINSYNAYFRVLSKKEKLPRNKIFKTKSIEIANTKFSLNDIEHGILRKYRWKWSFGYLPNPFVSPLIRNLAVQKLDYRIHFALNCGAKSCPPIAFYTLEKLDKQLDEASYSFIISETTIDLINKTIKTSKLLYWYQGDFGGTSGIKDLLQQILQLDFDNYKLSFYKYNRETDLDNYA